MLKRIFFLAVVSVLLFGCIVQEEPVVAGNESEGKEKPVAVVAQARPLVFENSFYSLEYSGEWSVSEGEGVAVFSSPQDENDAFVESVYVIAAPAEEEATLREYFENSVDALASSLEGFEVSGFNETRLSGVEAYEVEYTAKNQGQELKYKQVFAAKNEVNYVITYAGLGEGYKKHSQPFEKMLASFEMKDGKQKTEQAETPAAKIKWRSYSKSIYYDDGDFEFLKTPEEVLRLNDDKTWEFGSGKGTWEIAEITASDWSKWGLKDYGPTKKMVLYEWNNDAADGPIEGSGELPALFWMIYRVPPQEQGKAGGGQVQEKFRMSIE